MFCDRCGTPVASDRPGEPVAQHGAVRKTVTVFFCDLVGSTSLGERLDAESSREVMGRYHAMAQQIIEAHGGSVAKFIGDGVMALFGVPEVAADDAARAVATGLDLQRSFLPFAELIGDRYAIDVGLRVGINTGEVVIADTDADVVGDALNTAARLEAACTPGQVLVGEETWRLTRSAISYEVFGELELKGKDVAVATFRAIDEVVAVDDSTTPFVGRGAELVRLQNVFDEAVEQRSVRLATVIGAPGVGKTRLARELRRAIADRATVIDLRCERSGSTTFSPVADLLRFVSDIDDSMSADDVIAELARLVADLDDADRVATLLGSFVGASPTRSTEELFFAVRRLVESLGRQRPIVLVVDDIQWAEPLFLDVLEHLAEWVQDSPAMLLGLARPELREIRPTLAEPGRRVADTISLEGLDAAATAELAALLVGADSLPNDLLARLPESTEGNPLFVRELMKMLVDDGVIIESAGRWELTIDAEAVEVPPTIQSLLSTRIERMPADERRLVELAAVVGPDFPLGAVAAISATTDVGRLMPTLERLRRKELVEPTGTYWGNEPLFRFHHVLIRDAAYRRLLKDARAELHLQVGAWIEATAANLTGEHDVTIGYHLEQAHEYRRQLNVTDDETTDIGKRAADLLGSAAMRSLERDDVAAAGSLAIRAVARLDVDAEELPELLMLGCEALLALGDVAAARPLLKQLAGRSGDDSRLAAWTACFEAQLVVLTEPDRLDTAEAAAASAADDLATLGDQAGEAKARLIRAGALARLGRIGDCEAQLDLALTAARAANDGRRVAAVLGAAPVAALWGPSPVSRAGGRCLDVIRLLRITTGSPGVEAISTRCQAVLEALRGRFDTARTMLGEARATVEELGLRHGLLETDLYSGIVELLANDPVAAEPYLRDAYGGLGRLGIGADAGQAAAYLARSLLLQGRLDEAEELAADSDALAGQNPQTLIAARTAHAEILAARGELVEALGLAEAAVELASGSDIVIDHAQANVALARVRLAAGDTDGAVEARNAAQTLFEQKGATVDLGDLAQIDVIATEEPALAFPRENSAADTTNPAGADHEPWNEADRLSRSMLFDYQTDPDVIQTAFSVEIEAHDNRDLVGGVYIGRDAVVDAFPPGFVEQRDLETVASRGDHLVLFHSVVAFADGGPEIELLLIHRWNDNGQLGLYCMFNPDDYARAIDELDRLYLEEVDDLTITSTIRYFSEVSALLSSRDPGDAMAYIDPGCQLHDHRQIGRSTLDYAGLRHRFETLSGLRRDGVSFPARYRGIDGPTIWLESNVRVIGDDGAVQVDLQHLVTTVSTETGLILTADQFADDQIEAARARFRDMVAEQDDHIPWSAASWVGDLLSSWARLGSWGQFAGALAEGVTIEGSDGVSLLDGGNLVEPEVARSVGFGVDHRRRMAVRGERLALCELRDDRVLDGGEPFHRFVVEEIDGDGRLTRMTHFDADSLPDAVRHLGYRWVDVDAIEHREVAGLAIEFAYADSLSDSNWARTHLSDDCMFVDHRELGWPTGDKAWMIDTFEASPETQGATVNPIVLGLNERGGIAPMLTWMISDSGELVQGATPAIAVMQVTDGQVSAIEQFAEDDLDGARARFDELTSPLLPPSEHEPWNEADRLIRTAWERYAAQDVDAWLAVLDPDCVLQSRRKLGGGELRGRQQILEAYGSMAPASTVRSLSMETIASRGDRLAVVRTSMHVEVEDGGSGVIEWLGLSRVNAASKSDLNIAFDPNDYAAAVAELDRLYLEEVDDDTERAFVRQIMSLYGALNRRELDDVTAYYDDALEEHDHQQLGWPTLDLAGSRDRLVTLTESPAGFSAYIARYHRIDALGVILEHHLRVVGTSGSEQIDQHLVVGSISGESGLIDRIHRFGFDQSVEADVHFDRAALASRHVLHNAACQVGNSANSWALRGRVEPLMSAVSDDITIEHERRGLLMSDRDALRDMDTARGLGFGVAHRRLMAIRGERLALCELRDDEAAERFHRFVVEEIDGSGQLFRVTHFEVGSLIAAARFLDLRWLEIDRDARGEVVAQSLDFAHAHRLNDTEWFRHHLTDDFVFTDHRSLGFGTQDKAGMIAALETAADIQGVTIGRRAVDFDGSVLQGPTVMWVVDESGGLLEAMPAISVMKLHDRMISLVEMFSDDAPDNAQARFDELSRTSHAVPAPSGAPPTELVRFVTSGWEAFAHAVTERNMDTVMALMDARLEMVDHRQLGWPVVDYEGFRGRVESLSEIPGDLQITITQVHRVDGVLSFVETVTHIDLTSGAAQDDRNLLISEIGTDTGLTLRSEQFSGHEMDEAVARFDEMFMEVAGRSDLWNTATMVTNRACSWALLGHEELVDTLVAEDVQIEGHGESRPAEVSDFNVSYRRVLAVRGERLALIELRDDGDADDPDHRFAVVELDDEIRLAHMTQFGFDRESLVAAADLLEERWLDSWGTDQRSRSGVGFEMLGAFRHRDVARLTEVLGDDIEILDRRPLRWDDYGKDAWIELIGQLPDLAGVAVASRIMRFEESGAVVRLSQWAFSAGGDLDEMLPGIYIAITDGAQVTHIEGHSDDDPAAALARFDELTAELPVQRPAETDSRAPSNTRDDITTSDPVVHEPWNGADRLARRLLRWLVDRDLDAYFAALSPAVVVDDRRTMIREVFEGREQAMASMAPGIYPADSTLVADVEIVACRGEHLVVERVMVHEAGRSDGPTLAFLGVLSWTDTETLGRAVLFDPDDYHSAVAELDALFLKDLDDPALGSAVRTYGHAVRAISSGDVALGMQISDPALRFVDHRQMGWPEQNFEGFLERLRSFHEVGGTVQMFAPRVHGIDGRVILFDTMTIVSTPDGAVYLDRNLLVTFGGDTGRVTEQHQYSTDQFDEATEKYNELRRPDSMKDRLVNAATSIGYQLHRWMSDGFWDWVRVVLADDVVVEDRHGHSLISDAGEIATEVGARRLGLGAEHRDVMAIRGDRLALVHLHGERDGEPFHRFAVEEVTPSGQIGQITQFDFDEESLRAATDFLEDRWLDIDPLGDSIAGFCSFEWTRVWGRDRTRLSDLASDDVVIDDRKPLGWPKMGKAEWFELTSHVQDLSGAVVVSRFESLSETGGIAQLSHWHFSDGGDLDEMLPGLYLVVSRNGELVHVESHAETLGLNFAVDRLAELNAEYDSSALAPEAREPWYAADAVDAADHSIDDASFEYAPWNTADRLGRQMTLFQLARDDLAFGEMFADDAVLDDRRALVGNRTVGRDAIMAAIATEHVPSDSEFVADIETVASRGDDFVLMRTVTREAGSPDGPAFEWLAVSSWTASGQCDHAVMFDPDRYVDAVAELDRLFRERVGDDTVALATRAAEDL